MNPGGKARALMQLRDAGCAVPPFFVCDPNWSDAEITRTIDEVLPEERYFAVRSSAESEDSAKQSFAGHFYSGIAVEKNNVPHEVRKVVASFHGAPGAVIVQTFIPSDTAGVLFTKAGRDRMLVNATVGLCAPVVQGDTCDEYLCTTQGAIVHKTITHKQARIFEAGHIRERRIDRESLTDREIRRLAELARTLEGIFKSPQDIEWCFKDGRLYVLQSRPITREVHGAYEEFFDSANIAESYSGIVLPLTCSFAKMVYASVYKDLLSMSGVSSKKLEDHSYLFENLLGFFYGRMYYNMNNWYRMAEFVPGYRRNKRNFELMITSNVREEVPTAIRPSLTLRILYPLFVVVKVATYGITASLFRFRVTRHLRSLRELDFTYLEYNHCVALFDRINTTLLRRWYVTLENDFFVMTYLGILKKLFTDDELQTVVIFRSKATEQVEALAALSARMQQEQNLWHAVLSEDLGAFNREMLRLSDVRFALREYLHTFGGRFGGELKLESVGVDEDLGKLFATLKAYARYRPKPLDAPPLAQMPYLKKVFAAIVVHSFKKYARRREEFRLLRSNTFGMARKLFRRMGTLLCAAERIAHADDIFYLQLNEIIPLRDDVDLRGRVAERKREYASYKNIVPPPYFSTVHNEPPPPRAARSMDSTIKARGASPGIVRGRVRVFKDFSMPDHVDFDIVVTSHTDPGWTPLIALSKGLIIEHGGVLSHASIVARELGIPAVIGAANAVATLRDNQMVEIDGTKGIITVLDHGDQPIQTGRYVA